MSIATNVTINLSYDGNADVYFSCQYDSSSGNQGISYGYSSGDISGGTYVSPIFYITYTGIDDGHVYFTNDFVISSANFNTNAQFIINSSNIIVNGQGNYITFDNVTNYNGLITVGTAGLGSIEITGFNAIISTMDTTSNNNTGFLYSSQLSVNPFAINNCTYTFVTNADMYFTYNSSGVSNITTPVISYSLTNPNVITTPPTEVTSVPLYGSAPIINISNTNSSIITLYFTNNFSINDNTQFVLQSSNIIFDGGSINAIQNGSNISSGNILTFNPVVNYTGLITTTAGTQNITIQNMNIVLSSGVTNLNNTCGYIYYAQYLVDNLLIQTCNYTITTTPTNTYIYFTYLQSDSFIVTAPYLGYSLTTQTGSLIPSVPLYGMTTISIQNPNNYLANVYFTNDFTITNSFFQFVLLSSDITVDGGNNTVTFVNVTNYVGLISTAQNLKNITIQNIITDAESNCNLFDFFGWIYTPINSVYNMLIQNCVNNCDIYNAIKDNNHYCGGIVGSGINANGNSYSYFNDPCVLTITNCGNTGIVSSINGGGIAGGYSCSLDNITNINNCYNIGIINVDNAGGIVGSVTGNNGTLNITNCYNIGAISGQNSGGIVPSAKGLNYYPNIINITNCYNAGSIIGTNAGGLMGEIAWPFLDNYYDINSPTIIQGYGSVNITNCYNSASISTISGASGICPTTPITNLTITNIYDTNNGPWSDITANTYLTGYPAVPNPMGTTWTSIGMNFPYLLSSFNSSIHSPSVANFTPNTTAYQSEPAVINRDVYTIVAATSQMYGSNMVSNYNFINTATISSSGAITFTPDDPASQTKYTLYVVASNISVNGIQHTYQTSTFTINNVACFNHDTKILVLNNNLEEKYVPIQNLRIGDKVKTYLHGYKQIKKIGKGQLLNDPNIKGKNCMYKMEKTDTNGLIEDLTVTGGHSIMVDELTEIQSNLQASWNFNESIDNKKLLFSCLSADFKALQNTDVYTYYHFILENDGDKNKRYGVYANGLLMETPSENSYDWLIFTPI